VSNPSKPGLFARNSVARYFLSALALVVALGGCSKFQHTDTTKLDQAGMWVNSVDQLRQLKITDPEVQQLVLAHQAGLTDAACVELLRISHARQQIFASGQAAGGLLEAGFHEDSILELARLNQLSAWSGEAQAMRLAGLSDEVVLAVAKRRAAGQPVLSSRKIADLQNAGLTQNEIIVQINRGATDAQADEIVARRTYAAGGHSFVHQRGLRSR
jgi:hypothetical protein